MTDQTPLTPHPDDERLSAVLDGEGQPADRDHAVSCAACAARLGQFRAVAAAVRAPVPAPDPERRAEAIGAALATAGVDRQRSGVVSLDQRRLRNAAPRWFMAAAVLLLLVLAVPAAIRFAGDGDTEDSAASGTTALSADSAAGSAEGEPVEQVRDAGDLGDIGADSDLPAQLGLASDRSTGGAAAAPTTTAAGRDDEADAPAAAESFSTTCEAVVREDDPQLGPLIVSARARFDGEPVEVLGFQIGQDVRVYAVAVGTCELRTVQFAR